MPPDPQSCSRGSGHLRSGGRPGARRAAAAAGAPCWLPSTRRIPSRRPRASPLRGEGEERGAGRSAGTRCPLTGCGRAAESPQHCPAAPRRAARLRGRPWRAGGRGRGGGRRRREGGGRTADSELRGPLRTGAGWDRALRWTFPASLKPRRSGRPLHPSELPGRSVPPAARPDLAPRVRSERRAKRPAPLPGASVLSSRGSEPPAALEVGGFSFQTMPVIHSLVS